MPISYTWPWLKSNKIDKLKKEEVIIERVWPPQRPPLVLADEKSEMIASSFLMFLFTPKFRPDSHRRVFLPEFAGNLSSLPA